MAKAKEEKIQPLRIYLLKKSVTSFAKALKKGVTFKEYDLKGGLKSKGKLFLRPPVRHPVNWYEFVQSGVQKELPKIESVANAAVLFLKVKTRIVALVFGTGRYLLDDTAYETDFGLRSTLNAVDPRTLDQIDVNWFGEMVVHKRVQVSQRSSLAAFEIDVNRERFSSVTGKAKDTEFGTRVHGAEGGFGIHARVEFGDLIDHCKKCIQEYTSKEYQKSFPRHDDFGVLKDSAKINELNDKLVAKLTSKRTAGLHMSPPQIIDFDDFSGFSFSPKGDIYSELSITDYLASGHDFSNLTFDGLKSHRVFLRLESAAEPLDKWSAYKCLICEISDGSNVYVLWDGQWCRIAKKFADRMREEIESIPEGKADLPAKTKLKCEAPFLNDVAKKKSDLALMDQENVWCDNAGSEIEACDLFSTRCQFIHVKRRAHGAQGLSHLFAQGRNSAEAFLRDDSFRKGVKSKLQSKGAKFGGKIPITRPNPEKFEIVYVVMGKKRKKFVKDLPFFSQLTLGLAARDLRTMGFKISFMQVESPE